MGIKDGISGNDNPKKGVRVLLWMAENFSLNIGIFSFLGLRQLFVLPSYILML